MECIRTEIVPGTSTTLAPLKLRAELRCGQKDRGARRTHQEHCGNINFEDLLDLPGPGDKCAFQQVHMIFVADGFALGGQGQDGVALGQASSDLDCSTTQAIGVCTCMFQMLRGRGSRPAQAAYTSRDTRAL